VLTEVAAAHPPGDVVHVELDCNEHLDLVRRCQIMRIPTVVVLDGTGRIVARASGVPAPEILRAQLGEALAKLS
jgi:thioredoxin-like negative regulator of GroEL